MFGRPGELSGYRDWLLLNERELSVNSDWQLVEGLVSEVGTATVYEWTGWEA